MILIVRNKIVSLVIGLGVIAGVGIVSVSADIYAADYTLSITTSGSRSINVSPRADGVGTSISADNINVQTSCRAGYNLAISTSVDDNKLYLDGNSSNNASGTYFSPAGGNSTLKDSPNTWGFLMSGTTPTEDSTFAAVPTISSPAAVLKEPVASTADIINDNFNVYYGVSVANTMDIGKYKMIPDTSSTPNKDGAIVYYLTMADACTSYTVQYSPTSTFEGNTLTGTGTVADQSIKEGIATNLTTSIFTAPSGYYFAGWNTAQDGSGTTYASGQSVTDLAAVGETITLYAQWTNCPGGYVCYNANANDTTGSMGQQSLVAKDWSRCAYTDHETYCLESDYNEVDINTLPDLPGQYVVNAALQASNFKRPGYGFAGWNDKADMAGTNYGSNQTITIPDTISTKGLNLYAHWVESSGNLQGWTGCSTLTTNQVIGLTDTRDGNVYAVSKLADGNCWMIENLRLADTDSASTTITLDSTNTNNPASGFTALAATSNDWCAQYNSESCVNQNKLNTTNTISFTTNTTGIQSSDIYSYGNYYNWYSATAGNGTYSQTSGNAAGDICPSGWALPTGNTGGQFEALNTAINSSATDTSAGLRAYPANFIYSGDWHGSSTNIRGNHGYYWTRSAYNNVYNAYSLRFHNTGVSPGIAYSNKFIGLPARCVAQ